MGSVLGLCSVASWVRRPGARGRWKLGLSALLRSLRLHFAAGVYGGRGRAERGVARAMAFLLVWALAVAVPTPSSRGYRGSCCHPDTGDLALRHCHSQRPLCFNAQPPGNRACYLGPLDSSVDVVLFFAFVLLFNTLVLIPLLPTFFGIGGLGSYIFKFYVSGKSVQVWGTDFFFFFWRKTWACSLKVDAIGRVYCVSVRQYNH